MLVDFLYVDRDFCHQNKKNEQHGVPTWRLSINSQVIFLTLPQKNLSFSRPSTCYPRPSTFYPRPSTLDQNPDSLIKNSIHCTQWKHRKKLVEPLKASRDKWRVKRVRTICGWATNAGLKNYLQRSCPSEYIRQIHHAFIIIFETSHTGLIMASLNALVKLPPPSPFRLSPCFFIDVRRFLSDSCFISIFLNFLGYARGKYLVF